MSMCCRKEADVAVEEKLGSFLACQDFTYHVCAQHGQAHFGIVIRAATATKQDIANQTAHSVCMVDDSTETAPDTAVVVHCFGQYWRRAGVRID